MHHKWMEGWIQLSNEYICVGYGLSARRAWKKKSNGPYIDYFDNCDWRPWKKHMSPLCKNCNLETFPISNIDRYLRKFPALGCDPPPHQQGHLEKAQKSIKMLLGPEAIENRIVRTNYGKFDFVASLHKWATLWLGTNKKISIARQGVW